MVRDTPVSLPYTNPGNFSLLRDLTSVTAVLPDVTPLLQGTKITCSSATDTCVVFAEDWIAATSSYGIATGKHQSKVQIILYE